MQVHPIGKRSRDAGPVLAVDPIVHGIGLDSKIGIEVGSRRAQHDGERHRVGLVGRTRDDEGGLHHGSTRKGEIGAYEAVLHGVKGCFPAWKKSTAQLISRGWISGGR